MDTVNDEVEEVNSNKFESNNKCDNKTIQLKECNNDEIIQASFCFFFCSLVTITCLCYTT